MSTLLPRLLALSSSKAELSDLPRWLSHLHPTLGVSRRISSRRRRIGNGRRVLEGGTLLPSGRPSFLPFSMTDRLHLYGQRRWRGTVELARAPHFVFVAGGSAVSPADRAAHELTPLTGRRAPPSYLVSSLRASSSFRPRTSPPPQ